MDREERLIQTEELIKTASPGLIKEFLEFKKETTNLSRKTRIEYGKDLNAYFDYLKVAKKSQDADNKASSDILLDVTDEDIGAYFNHLKDEKELSVPTIRRKHSSVKGFYSYLTYSKKLFIRNPVEELKLSDHGQKDVLTMSLSEAMQLVEAVKHFSKYPERDTCMLNFLLHLGLNREELVSLNLQDIVIKKNNSHVVVNAGTKDERIIPLDNVSIYSHHQYLPHRFYPKEADSVNALFLSNRGIRISADSVYYMIKKLAKKANLSSSITPSVCRNTFASFTLQKDADIISLHKVLGNKKLKTTEKYLELIENDSKELIDNNALNKDYQMEIGQSAEAERD